MSTPEYNAQQIERAEQGHDWTYAMQIQVTGTKGRSNYLPITKAQLKKIKKILKP